MPRISGIAAGVVRILLSAVLTLMHATLHCKTTSAACYSRHEQEKRQTYEKKINNAEHVSFTPIVLSSSGSWGPSATMAFMRQTSFLSVKLDQPYSRTLIDIPSMQSHLFPVCNVCNLIIIYSIFTKQQLIYLYTTCTIYSSGKK